MKTLSALILSSMALVATAQAAERYCAPACEIFEGKVNYDCIASRLEAYNSDIYYNMSVEDINKQLYTCKYAGHDTVLRVAQECERR